MAMKNAKYAVVSTAFHGGGVISSHQSLAASEKAAKKCRIANCECGCCAVVPIATQAREEMPNHGRDICDNLIPLLEEIPVYTGNEFSPYVLRR